MFVDQRGGEALGNGKSIPMGLKHCKVLQWMSSDTLSAISPSYMYVMRVTKDV